MQLKTNDRVFVCGMTGSGKSHFLKKAILQKFPRWVFYDPKHQHESVAAQVTVYSLQDLMTAIDRRNTRIHYKPKDDDDYHFDEMCRIVYQVGNMSLVMDEVMTHATPHNLPKYYGYILRMGRSRGVGCVTTTQNPVSVHNTAISESDHFILYRVQLESHREKLRGIIGDDAEKLNTLEEFEFVYYTWRGGAVVCKPI